MRIAICDDDRMQLNLLKSYIGAYDGQILNLCVHTFSSGNDLVKAYETSEPYDIIFLDGEMEGITGVETAQRIRETDEQAIIFFISGYQKFVPGAFKLNAFQFLTKPVSVVDFNAEFERALKHYHTRHRQYSIVSRHTVKTFEIKKILYIEAYNRKITIHTAEDHLTIAGKLNDEEIKLSNMGFIRVHQGFLVNMDYIKVFEKEYLLLKNNTKIPLSDRKRKVAYDTYTKYLMGYSI